MLEIENLHRTFGATQALTGVSLTVGRGEMVGIVGRSGAGKSTLLRAVNGLTSPTSGRIRYAGQPVTQLRGRQQRAWRRRCAMIFQQFNLVSRLDVLTNVLVGRVAHRSTTRTLFKLFTPAERALAVLTLERVGIAEQILQRADTLSGGQQQRVAIARALVQEPDVVLADEPIASLDPHNARLVMETLHEINRSDGITTVVNVHSVEMARAYCDRLIGMREGEIVFEGASASLDDQALARIYDTQGVDAATPEPSNAAETQADESWVAAVAAR